MTTKTDRDDREREPVASQAERSGGGDGFYVVGIGASAGGLESLERFFASLESDPGMAFVVIQHLSPDYKSLMAELLSKHTTMPCIRAANGMPVEPNKIYLIPPRTSMTVHDGHLSVVEHNRHETLHLPIDVFFQSLGEDMAERGIGIVLSGTGSDGMRGIRSIKDASGMVMVQDLADAKFDGMPRSAISTGLADFILPADEMPKALLQFVQNPRSLGPQERAGHLPEEHEEALRRVMAVVGKQAGIDFTCYKPSTVVRRVERRMNIRQCQTAGEYADLLASSPAEVSTLHKELLIGVTRFFRDDEAFSILEKEVISELFDQTDHDATMRVWVAGCSTGEEAYSLAMLLLEHMDARELNRRIKIFATDVDKDAVEFAAEGVYPESIVADVSPERLQKFFVRMQDHYQVSRRLRETVVFAPHSVIKDPPFSNMDLVSCRNLLIYLKPEAQKRVLALLAYSLKHEGFLVLGSSEMPGESSTVFRPVNSKWKIYRKMSSARGLINDTLVSPSTRPRDREMVPAVGGASSGQDQVVLERAIQELMLARHAGCLVLDADFNVMHIFGEVDDLIQIQPGRASLDARRMTSNELAVAMGTALSRAKKTAKEVSYSQVELKRRGITVDLRVRPISIRRKDERLYLVILERSQSGSRRTDGGDEYDHDSGTQQRISDLEQELQFTKANLQATIEELQTSNEELQATNEELVTSNEELQSTNEELQSVNEELHTVNTEYQEKIEELTQINNDVNNLLRATRIGTIFLDRELSIRKFTPAVSSFLNILPQDLGRPISHITGMLSSIPLEQMARKVLRTRSSVEVEDHGTGKRSLLVRFLPYLTDEGVMEGVVITFVDLSDLRRRYISGGEQDNRLLELLTSVDEVVWSVELPSRNFMYFSPSVETLFGYRPSEFLADRDLWNDVVVPEDRRKMREFFTSVIEAGSERVSVRIRRKNGTVVRVSVHGQVILDEQGDPCRINGITHAETLDPEIEERFQSILDSLSKHVAVLDSQGTILQVNEIWRESHRLRSDGQELKAGKNYLDALDCPEKDPTGWMASVRGGILRVLSGETPEFILEHPMEEDGVPGWYLTRIRPLAGHNRGVVVTHVDITRRVEAERLARENSDSRPQDGVGEYREDGAQDSARRSYPDSSTD
jgi:two-component system CheB/CheR fusion protein